VEQIGKVTKVDEKNVEIKVERSAACDNCRACDVFSNRQDIVINVKNKLDLKLDEEVAVNFEEINFLKAILIMYGLPFLFMLIGIITGLILKGEMYALILGMINVVFAYVLISLFQKKFRFKYKISRK